MIGKLEAAERLIVCGVEMSSNGSDPLGVHVVASSALNVLRDLIRKEGEDYVSKVLREGLFLVSTALANGEKITLPIPPENEAVVQNVTEAVKAGHIKCADDIKINLNDKQCREMLDYVYSPYNFLKHADRDPLATLDESDIDPAGVLAHAITAFSMLRPKQALPDAVGTFLSEHGIT